MCEVGKIYKGDKRMMLGNLSIKKMEDRMGIEFPEELKNVLLKCRQENVSIDMKEGFWHCFDLPFTFVCGGKDLAELMVEHLTPMVAKMTTPLHVAISKIETGYKKIGV